MREEKKKKEKWLWNDETSKAALQEKRMLSILGLSIQKEVLLVDSNK